MCRQVQLARVPGQCPEMPCPAPVWVTFLRVPNREPPGDILGDPIREPIQNLTTHKSTGTDMVPSVRLRLVYRGEGDQKVRLWRSFRSRSPGRGARAREASSFEHRTRATPPAAASTFTSNSAAERMFLPSSRPTRAAIVTGSCFSSGNWHGSSAGLPHSASRNARASAAFCLPLRAPAQNENLRTRLRSDTHIQPFMHQPTVLRHLLPLELAQRVLRPPDHVAPSSSVSVRKWQSSSREGGQRPLGSQVFF